MRQAYKRHSAHDFEQWKQRAHRNKFWEKFKIVRTLGSWIQSAVNLSNNFDSGFLLELKWNGQQNAAIANRNADFDLALRISSWWHRYQRNQTRLYWFQFIRFRDDFVSNTSKCGVRCKISSDWFGAIFVCSLSSHCMATIGIHVYRCNYISA